MSYKIYLCDKCKFCSLSPTCYNCNSSNLPLIYGKPFIIVPSTQEGETSKIFMIPESQKID